MSEDNINLLYHIYGGQKTAPVDGNQSVTVLTLRWSRGEEVVSVWCRSNSLASDHLLHLPSSQQLIMPPPELMPRGHLL